MLLARGAHRLRLFHRHGGGVRAGCDAGRVLDRAALAPARAAGGEAHQRDTAEGECYGVALGFRREDESEPYKGNMYGGRYLDTYEKRGDEWRISSRRYVMDWTMPMPDQPDASPNAAFPLPMLDLRESGHPDYRRM
ncbi:MAG: nuclear transport factor 2 family protein [Erythrobacter sp.]